MRKGISEIISSVLLVAIAVSVAGVYAQWAPEFASDTSQEAATQAENNLKCSNAAFDISGVEYDRTGQISKFNLSNKGTITFNNDIMVTSINSSRITGQKTVTSLEVDETRLIELESEKVTESLIASSQECPGLKITEDNIKVSK